jgi:hypothetical protein
MSFTHDRLTLWILSGVIGSVVRELFDFIAIWIGLPIIVRGMPHMFMFKPTIFNALFAMVPHSIYAGVTAFCIVRFTKIESW